MNTKIFYFTGTGNSLSISKKIADKLGNAEITPLVGLLNGSEPFVIEEEVIGFVFPVYFLNLPDIVRETISKCIFKKNAYIFATITSGGNIGNSLFELNHLLKKGGNFLSYGVEIPLGDNSIVISTPDVEFQNRLKKADETIEYLCNNVTVRNLENNKISFRKKCQDIPLGIIIYLVMKYYYNFKKQKVDKLKCNKCGICQKICPVNNISMKEKEVYMNKHCKWCFSCINYCPNQAISFGKIQPTKENQYHFPGIKVLDIISQKTYKNK